MIVVTMPWGASLLSEKTLQLEMLLIPQQYLLCQKNHPFNPFISLLFFVVQSISSSKSFIKKNRKIFP